jgi:hypothetical protein
MVPVVSHLARSVPFIRLDDLIFRLKRALDRWMIQNILHPLTEPIELPIVRDSKISVVLKDMQPSHIRSHCYIPNGKLLPHIKRQLTEFCHIENILS